MEYVIDSDDVRGFLGPILPELNEKQRRHILGALSIMMGHGGIKAVSEISGVSTVTISKGRTEIREMVDGRPALSDDLDVSRVRDPGAGRKTALEAQPGLDEAIESMLYGNTAGDPESPLTWTTLSTRDIAESLKSKGFSVSHVTVSKLLAEKGYSLQQNRKHMKSGEPGPDRDRQFRFIQTRSSLFMTFGFPVISVDMKRKELVENYKNPGAEYRPVGDPRIVNDHDFAGELGKPVPYGIYDIGRDEGYASVGISADTAEFAVNSIRSWWTSMGSEAYPEATMLMIVACCGGRYCRRSRQWRTELQRFSDETGLTITVCHFPPGTSKWNRIEHRLFSFISMNWSGRPLLTYEVIINLIGNIKDSSAPEVKCELDHNEYLKVIKISDEGMDSLNIAEDSWHGEWNYIISPRVNH